MSIKAYKVPQDVISDVFRILFKYEVKYKIRSVQSNENIIKIEVDYTRQKNVNAQENIETILDDYREFMKDIVGDFIDTLEDEDDLED
jgi:DNA-directed RNA polymerase subunit L